MVRAATERAPGAAAEPADAGAPRAGAAALLRAHWPLLAVLGVYAVTAVFVVPTLAPVAISDDWQYARSVEILLTEGRLRILPFSAANAFFPLLWGSLFAGLFGVSFGVLRAATVVLVALSAWALYGLCLDLGISRARSALGVALYLFNPIAYSISFTFMTDPYLLALLVIAAYCFVHAVHTDRLESPWVVAGSLAAALAYLARQQGALIPLAFLSFLVLTGRLRWGRRGLGIAARVLVIPLVVNGAFYLWLKYVNGLPPWNQQFVTDVLTAGPRDTALLVGRMTFIGAMYAGLFVLPIAAAAYLRVPALARSLPRAGWWAVSGAVAVVALGLAFFAVDGRRMPYIPHFFHPFGVGANDLLGARQPLAPPWVFMLLTVACAIAFLVAVAAVAAARERDPAAGLVAVLLAWMALGALLPSFGFRDWVVGGVSAPSLDRYLLPLLPLVLCLLLWALRGQRLAPALLWLPTAVIAALVVAGTRDSLVMQTATWQLNRDAIAMGIPQTRLDGGAAWGGYHLAEYSADNEIPVQAPNPTWWNVIWSTATDAGYAVTTSPLPDYEPIERLEYSQWLRRGPEYLYLLRRSDVPAP